MLGRGDGGPLLGPQTVLFGGLSHLGSLNFKSLKYPLQRMISQGQRSPLSIFGKLHALPLLF